MLGPIHLTTQSTSDFGKYFYIYTDYFVFTCKFRLRTQAASTLAYIINTSIKNSSNIEGYRIGINSSYQPYITIYDDSYTGTATFTKATLWADTEYTLSVTQTNTSTGSYKFHFTVSSASQDVTISRSQFIYSNSGTSSATFGDSNVDLLSITLKGKQYNVGTQAVFTLVESNCTDPTFSKAISGPASTAYSWTVDNYPTVKYYNGSSWVRCQVKYYDGTSWRICVPRYYDGSSWRYSVNM